MTTTLLLFVIHLALSSRADRGPGFVSVSAVLPHDVAGFFSALNELGAPSEVGIHRKQTAESFLWFPVIKQRSLNDMVIRFTPIRGCVRLLGHNVAQPRCKLGGHGGIPYRKPAIFGRKNFSALRFPIQSGHWGWHF